MWGGRWQEGASGTTGEEVELVNSHFSRLGTTTKHMLPESKINFLFTLFLCLNNKLPMLSICFYICSLCSLGREELLTEHAMSWNKRKIVGLPVFLSKRYAKVRVTYLVYL